MGGASELLSGSFSDSSVRNRQKFSPQVAKPVLLVDYYENYEDHSSVEATMTDDWSSLLLQKKKTIRA